jgi:transposase InsO family protein
VAREANELWVTDFKGEFRTSDEIYCYPLTLTDLYSRYLVGCKGLLSTKTDGVKKSFERLFREYGLPEAIRSDNGVPFASTGLGRLSRLSVWWIELGIRPELTQPARPEQNGSHERMHRTLKRATTRPADLYRPSPRAFPTVVPRMECPGHFEVRRVGRNGRIWNLHCGPLLLGRFDEREETLYAAFYAQRPWYRGGRAGRAAEGSTQEVFRDLHSATTTR